MAQQNDAIDGAQIESTLVFDVEQYRDYEPFERVAEGVHECGDRMVEYVYDLDTETDETLLRVHARYYIDGELRKESAGATQSYTVENGKVQHGPGYGLEEFIQDNFMADPEVSVGDEFESMVEVN